MKAVRSLPHACAIPLRHKPTRLVHGMVLGRPATLPFRASCQGLLVQSASIPMMRISAPPSTPQTRRPSLYILECLEFLNCSRPTWGSNLCTGARLLIPAIAGHIPAPQLWGHAPGAHITQTIFSPSCSPHSWLASGRPLRSSKGVESDQMLLIPWWPGARDDGMVKRRGGDTGLGEKLGGCDPWLCPPLPSMRSRAACMASERAGDGGVSGLWGAGGRSDNVVVQRKYRCGRVMNGSRDVH